MTDAFKVGQLIELQDGRSCVIRFLGETSFSSGDWVGVEFEDASGKNDGSVQGERYFDCEMGHGMFLRPAGISRILEEPTPKPKTAPGLVKKDTTNATAGASKGKMPARVSTATASGSKRQSTMDPAAAKRQSLNSASPTPAPRRQSVINGHKPPSKLVPRPPGSTATSSAASSRGATPPVTGKSQLSRTTNASRPSIASARPDLKSGYASSSSAASAPPPRQPSASAIMAKQKMTANLAVQKQDTPVLTSAASKTNVPGIDAADSGNKETANISPTGEDGEVSSQKAETSSEPSDHESALDPQNEGAATNGHAEESKRGLPSEKHPAPVESKSSSRSIPMERKIEEYETKIKLLEKKRNEDREKLVSLEKLQTEKDKLEKIIHALQAKIAPQSQELSTLRTKLKEALEKEEQTEKILSEHESEMEMAALDREMAEETAEGLRTEFEALKQKSEELELEVEVLREENEELGREMNPEERASKGWLQMQRSEERMREALIRLRDVSQSQEADLKSQISALEEDLKELEGIKEQYDQTKDNLQQSEAAIEDLKQRLEAALASEDMVEELTDANESLSEQIQKLKIEVDELQMINELNDEFEAQHIQTEKQMQDEIDRRGFALSEAVKQVAQQNEKLTDGEYTITKFRELVTSLQSHLADMRASQQISEAEHEELNSRSRAMNDLNMKLQASATKTQVSIVDLEMRKLEAQEATEHLSITQMFLPDGFSSERNSVLVYLKFKRIGFKAQVLQGFLSERVAGNSGPVSPESVFTYCDIMDKLVWTTSMCERFVNDILSCPLERFARYETALNELEPVERGLNSYIEAWKKNDMKEEVVTEELQRSIAVLSHLAELHIQKDLGNYADYVLLRATLMRSHLDNSALALAYTTSMITRASGSDDDDEPEDETVQNIIKQMEGLVSQTRGAKVVAAKIATALEEFRSRSMTVPAEIDDAFDQSLTLTTSITTRARALGVHVHDAFEDAESQDNPLPTTLRIGFTNFRSSCFPDSQPSSNPITVFSNLVRGAADQLSQLLNQVSDVSRAVEFTRSPPPWTIRADELKSSALSTVNTESELQRLKESMNDRLRQLQARDQTLEEKNVKIELLESRIRDASTKASKIEELQKTAEAATKRGRELERAIEEKFREAQQLQTERDRWMEVAQEQREVDGFRNEGQGSAKRRSIASSKEVDALKSEIKALEGAVKFFRAGNSRALLADRQRTRDLAWLEEPLIRSKRQREESERRDNVEKEGKAVIGALLDLAATAQIVDLSTLPENKLAWQPINKKNGWIVTRQLEEWEAWEAGRAEFVARGKEFIDFVAKKRASGA